MKNYKVSLVIPVYNVEHYIEESLLSALNQSYENIEYLIVDDRGKDNSMSIVAEVVANHCRKDCVKIIKHNHNRGLSAARNTGVGNATGDYIYFMDSDDELTPDCIEKFCNNITQETDIICGNIQLVGAKSIHIKHLSDETIVANDVVNRFLKRELHISAWNKLYKSSFLRDNNLSFQEGVLHEDILFTYQCCKAAKQIKTIPDYTYLYKIRNNSITQNLVSRKRLNDLAFIITEIQHDRKDIDTTLHSQFDKYVQYLIFLTSLQLLKSELSTAERKQFYNNLRKEHSNLQCSIYCLANKLPYQMFSTLISLMYSIYKSK